MRFTKAHGAGNDFLLVPDPDGRLQLGEALVRALCRPHLGLGADGVIRVAPPRPHTDADVFMDYRNADGSAVEMCGNGVRCVAKYVADRGLVPGDVVRVDTRGGVKTVEIVGRALDGRVTRVRVDMGAPVPGRVNWAVAGQSVTTLSMGNPHAVIVVDDVEHAPVQTVGPGLERDAAFPSGTNVEFIHVADRNNVRGRIWERGVGETMSSGTGASAMAVAAHLLGLADRRVTVELPGGALEADWTDETLFITGPAVEVCSGEVDDAWLADSRSR